MKKLIILFLSSILLFSCDENKSEIQVKTKTHLLTYIIFYTNNVSDTVKQEIYGNRYALHSENGSNYIWDYDAPRSGYVIQTSAPIKILSCDTIIKHYNK